MKKYIFIAVFLCICVAGSIILYRVISASGEINDPVKLEDAIIIHGIEMDSDVPQADDEGADGDAADGEIAGKIIYNDAFDDALIDYDNVKKVGEGGARSKVDKSEFDRMKKKDKRWHLTRYRIKKNDNLWKIAKRFGVHPHLVISINEINDPDMLKPGRSIQVPTRKGVFYEVRKGDSISRIAARYKMKGNIIVAHNNIKKGAIRPGQRIFLPDAKALSEDRHIAVKRKKEQQGIIASLKSFIWPLRGRITSGFGTRKDPLNGGRQFHCGIDISANLGTKVRAAADGRVIYNGWKAGYGNVVIVRHDGGYITVYAHNSKNLAPEESMVKRGDTIAESGMTGAVTGAHLHFEIRKYVNPLNPLRLLSK